MTPIKTDLVILLGDTHGDWFSVLTLFEVRDIRDCVVIHAGDVGIGFVSKDDQIDILSEVNAQLAMRNIDLYAIRGNHDDPAYFTGDYQYCFDNLHLLPDYTTLNINGETWLFVGGAVSIDREAINHAGNKIRVQGLTWWEDEGLVYDPYRISQCDVLVTHTAPSWVGPFDKEGLKYYTDGDPTLWNECVVERSRMNEIVTACGAKKHYCGHFHVSTSGENNGCRSRILNILELLEHR